jgi:acyl-[acyl-carrier-protein] desaturase
MSEAAYFDSPEMQREVYLLYRDFFDMAEKRRRWSLRRDIPWDKCNSSLNPAIADIVESFCAVELYLPDYIGKTLPTFRSNRGRAWFMANWGYEESKHSLALGDWLLHSGQRSEEYMSDLEQEVFTHEWNLPVENIRGMVCYSMTQELATWLTYRNLRQTVGETGDPALYQLLGFISIDERAHYDFFRKVVKMHLAADRPGTLEQLRRVLNTFQMPALYMLADSRNRAAKIRELRILDEECFYKEVVTPILADLGVTRAELRRRGARSIVVVPAPAAGSSVVEPPAPASANAETLSSAANSQSEV